jgi:hypothetical protein
MSREIGIVSLIVGVSIMDVTEKQYVDKLFIKDENVKLVRFVL